jgi:PHD/YefM family antitoxin component YafN of YafNO toxin-antitoxin module
MVASVNQTEEFITYTSLRRNFAESLDLLNQGKVFLILRSRSNQKPEIAGVLISKADYEDYKRLKH